MKSELLNKEWKFTSECNETTNGIPLVVSHIDLPYDWLTTIDRDYNLIDGQANSYYPSVTGYFYKYLPTGLKEGKLFLDIDGVCQLADVYLNDILIFSITDKSHNLIEITDFYDKTGKNLLKLVITSPVGSSTKYTGAGISGGVKLITVPDKFGIMPYGIFVTTDSIGDKGAMMNVHVDMENHLSERKIVYLDVAFFNAKNRRVGRKRKAVKLPVEQMSSFELSVRISRPFIWQDFDPYIYRCVVSVVEGEKVLDSEEVNFGIMTVKLENKVLIINGKKEILKGVVVESDNGLLGNVSNYTADYRKFSIIKECGYTAVRLMNPSDTALDICDRLGLKCVVDIFDVWNIGKKPLDGHLLFKYRFEAIVNNIILQLRQHVSVIMYSLGDEVEESYNRNNGSLWCETLVQCVKAVDSHRLITCATTEFIPTPKELEKMGGKIGKATESGLSYSKAAIGIAREKNQFKNATESFFSHLDIVGYKYLYQRYSLDRLVNDRTIIGLATYPMKAFEAKEETDRNGNVIGDFAYCGLDYLGDGRGYVRYDENMRDKLRCTDCGEIDITGRRKPISYYKEIVNGKKHKSYIVAFDPDKQNKQQITDEFSLNDAEHLWNFPRFVGQNVTVQVYTSGDVVALYLDNKLIGRKLAGKINKHIATFKTNYYPGKLEAVSYYKGLEHCRCSLESVLSPKAIRINAEKKFVKSFLREDFAFIDIEVVDKEGRNVPYAVRDIEVSIIGEGEIVAFGNADPSFEGISNSTVCPVFNGHALLITRGLKEGKFIVKAISEGLTSDKVTIKVK